jgi:O-antigen/teichoic acid export membrane protein
VSGPAGGGSESLLIPVPPTDPAAAPSLLQRVLKGSSWQLLGNIASQVLRFGSNLVLTRLLYPEAFGLMAIVQSIIAAAHLFSDVGLMQTIIRSHRGHDPRMLNTIWTLDIVKGVMIWVVLGAIAVPVSKAYSQPMLAVLLPGMGLAALISSFGSTKIALVNRRIDIGRLICIELGAQIIGIVTMILWASLNRSPWALVGGNWASSLAMVVASHWLLKGPSNRFDWDRSVVQEVLSFGGWVMMSSSFTFLVGEGSNLLNASLVGPRIVAFLGLSTALVMVAWNAIQQICGRVLFPAYAEVWRERPGDLPRVVERSRQLQLLGSCAVATFFVLFGPKVIQIFYDARYHAVGAFIQIQAIGTIFMFVSSSYSSVLWAMGRPGLNTVLLVIQTAVTAALILVGYHYGGALGLVVGSAFIGLAFYPFNSLLYGRFGMFQPRTDIGAFVLGTLLAAYVYKFGAWQTYIG